MQNSYSSSANRVEIDRKKIKYETKIKAAALAALEDGNYAVARSAYSEALALANELHLGDMKICLLKYMICYCLVHSNKLDDLAEVVQIAQNINKTLKERLPAIYCVLAQAHCKLYRFDCALESLNTASDILSRRNTTLEIFYIPGTSMPIEQGRNSDMWLDVEKEIKHWHKPDAVCASKECNHITKPYVTPKMNIYKSDPAFNGMVIVHCSNKKRPCTLKFHPSCWKVIKDSTNLSQKVTEKDMLGVQCFTPNCMDDNSPSSISLIEIVGENGEVKAQIRKGPVNGWSGNKNVSQGAIKKQKNISKDIDTSHSTPQKEKVPVLQKHESNAEKKIDRYDGYDENQIITIVKDFSPDTEFIDSTPEGVEKAFLFSFFHQYIKNYMVRICDLYTKFSEISDNLIYLKDIDILTFLLDTNTIAAMDEESMKCSEEKRDVSDMLDELMNDCEISDTIKEPKSSNSNDILDKHHSYNVCNNIYKEEAAAASGDASSSYSSVNTIIDANQIEVFEENNKLKACIASLKEEIECMITETSHLRKEMQEKDHKIEIFVKQMDECEALYEKMADFKGRYDEIKDENFKLKEEIIVLMNEKKLLTEEAQKLNDPEEKRKEIKNMFQAEYEILQNCINASWKKKTETLESLLQKESEAKKSLLSQYLQTQFNANMNLINGYIEQCKATTHIIVNLNNWMEKYMLINTFKDSTEWMDRLNQLQKASGELQSNYTKLVQKLCIDESLTDVCLECPSIPDKPKESLSDIVMNALNASYKKQYETVQKQQQMNQHYQQVNHHLQQQQQQQQHWQAQQLQRSAGYNMHVYQVPALTSTLLPAPSPYTVTVPRPNMVQVPMMQQPVYAQPPMQPQVQQPPLVQNRIAASITKSNLEINELNSSNENVSVRSAPSSQRKLDFEEKINEEVKTKSSESSKDQLKGKVVKDTDESIENIDSCFNKLSEKKEQLRKALKAIALNVKEKSEADSLETMQVKERTNENSSVKVNGKVKSEVNNLQLEKYDYKSDVVSTSSKEDSSSPKSKKTAGINSLIKVMQKKYPEALEVDIIEIITEIRKKNNNTLTGKPVIEILAESEEFFSRKQRIHVMRYFTNDETKSSCSEPSNKVPGSTQQSSIKDRVPSTCNISDKFLNVTNSSSVQKNVWNVIPQEEVRWTVEGDIECSICMNIVSKRNCYTLCCRHSFHNECIKKWLKSDRSCPNCRVAVTEDEDFPPLPA